MTRMRRTGGRVTSLVDILDLVTDPHVQADSTLLPDEVVRLTRESEAGFGHSDGVQSLVLPLPMVFRDLNVGTPTAGGNLVGSPRLDAAPSLRGFSVVADAGATVLSLGEGTNAPGLPVVTSPPVAGWAADEYGTVPTSEAVFGLRSVAPKTIGFAFRVSRRLLMQGGPAADMLLRAEIASALGRGIDKAALQGTGSAGQPLGLTGMSGVYEKAGASLSWAGVQDMLDAVASGGARDEAVRVIGSPGVRKLLAQRERAAGNGFVWNGDTLAGKPAAVSRECPAGAMFVGDFRQLVVALHSGLSLLMHREGAVNGSVLVTAMVDADVVVLYPEALSRAVSIT